MSEQADGAKPVEGAPAQELPLRPAKQPKEKAPKEKAPKASGNKNAGLEVRQRNYILISPLYFLC